MDPPVHSARWQECEESMGWLRGVVCNTDGFVDAAVVAWGVDGG